MQNNDDIYKKLIEELDEIQQRADARHQELQKMLSDLFKTIENITGENRWKTHAKMMSIFIGSIRF